MANIKALNFFEVQFNKANYLSKYNNTVMLGHYFYEKEENNETITIKVDMPVYNIPINYSQYSEVTDSKNYKIDN